MAATWVARLSEAGAYDLQPAADLYSGRAFRRLRGVAEDLGCQFYVVSAGLGFVAADTAIPSYDLTLSPGSASSLQHRLTKVADPESWWARLEGSPYASALTDLGRGGGRILIALTQPYAKLIGAALARLPAADRERMRILGSGLEDRLPDELHPQLIAYDDRLSQIAPGTRQDSASRALAHFATLVRDQPVTTVISDQQLVEEALSAYELRTTPLRKRVSDTALLRHAARLARQGFSATSALRHLRDESLIACEERRFRRLFQEATE